MASVSSRREFLQSLSAAAGSAAVVNGVFVEKRRSERCCDVRIAAASFHKSEAEEAHNVNGDEALFPNGEVSFSKGLPHNSRGEPLPEAWRRLSQALAAGSFSSIESVSMGGPTKFTDPIAANAFALEGADSHRIGIPAPPSFSGGDQASEMIELYWQALTRDVPFAYWRQNDIIAAAAGDLGASPGFRGPEIGGKVTAQTLFRVEAPGVLNGPYVSQVLLKPVPYGDTTVEQRYRLPALGKDFAVTYKDWLPLQNGLMPMKEAEFETTPRYLATSRGLAGLFHRDFTFQAILNTALILGSFGPAALSDTNPYKRSRAQSGFATFGEPQIVDCLARAANGALKAAWFQKWLIHRRIRPEEFAYRAQETLAGRARYPLAGALAKSAAPGTLEALTGGLLLPLAYPEGCPLHPSYPGAQAVVAGGCITVLKAFFDERFEIPNPLVSDAEGESLAPYDQPLTIGGELNKLASNIAMSRGAAGVHWRSDGVEGIRLGETVALGVLRDVAITGAEPFVGFQLTRFDGGRASIEGPSVKA